jgi:hypothetical protein
MNDFDLFTLSTGETLGQKTEFENTGMQPVIPDGTQLECVVMAVEYKGATQYANQLVAVTLYVTSAGKYEGFTVKDNIKLWDANVKTVDKAKQKLTVYDAAGTNKLRKRAQANKLDVTDTAQLQDAIGGVYVIATFAEYEIEREDGTKQTGNWVRKIVAKNTSAQEKAIIQQAKAQPQAPVAPLPGEFDNDVPF